MTPEVEEIYEKLSAPMKAHELPNKRGADGKALKYATVHDVIERLNDALGVDGWSWELYDQGYDLEASAAWARGTLTAYFPTRDVRRSAIGGQDVNRGMSLGDCMKAAGTDAMKKAAASIGVALEFSEKDAPPTGERQSFRAIRPPTQGPVRQPDNGQAAPPVAAASESNGAELTCADCDKPLSETRFKDGTVWSAGQLAGYGRRKLNGVYCMTHYRERNDARRAAQPAEQRS